MEFSILKKLLFGAFVGLALGSIVAVINFACTPPDDLVKLAINPSTRKTASHRFQRKRSESYGLSKHGYRPKRLLFKALDNQKVSVFIYEVRNSSVESIMKGGELVRTEGKPPENELLYLKAEGVSEFECKLPYRYSVTIPFLVLVYSETDSTVELTTQY